MKACENSNYLIIALILGYSESIGTFVMAHNLWGGEGWYLRLLPFQNGMFNVTEIRKNLKIFLGSCGFLDFFGPQS